MLMLENLKQSQKKEDLARRQEKKVSPRAAAAYGRQLKILLDQNVASGFWMAPHCMYFPSHLSTAEKRIKEK